MPEEPSIDELTGGGDCNDALETLYHYLDGELTPERRAAIQRHLSHCGPCLSAFDFEAELKAVVARSCRDQVPETLRRRVAEVLDQASRGAGSDGRKSGDRTSRDQTSGGGIELV